MLVRAAAYSWRLLVVVAAGYVLVQALVTLRLVVFPVIIALFVSTVLAPPTLWLRTRGWPRAAATGVVMLAWLLLLGGIVSIIVPQVAGEVDTLGREIRRGSQRVLEFLAQSPLQLSRADINSYVDQAFSRLQESSGEIASGALSGAIVAGEVVAGLLLTAVLLFFFLKDGDSIFTWLIDHLAPQRREHAREMGLRAWRAMSAWVRGTALVALVDAVLIGVALLVIRVPLVVPLAVLTFFGGFFPVVGATVAGVVAVLVALVTGGLFDALLVGAAVLAIQQIEGHLLQPLVLGRAVRLHPIVVLLSLTAGGIVGGVAGAFLAVPTAAVVTAVGSYVHSSTEPEELELSG